MNRFNRNQVERILREYNSEYDVPDGPRVPWYAWMLAEAVMNQDKEIQELKERLDILSNSHEALLKTLANK